jgi:ubiquitin C-terminal hydrolase
MNSKDGEKGPPAVSISSEATSLNAGQKVASRLQTKGGNGGKTTMESPDMQSASAVTSPQVETLGKNGAPGGSDSSTTSGVTEKNDAGQFEKAIEASTAIPTGLSLASSANSEATLGQTPPDSLIVVLKQKVFKEAGTLTEPTSPDKVSLNYSSQDKQISLIAPLPAYIAGEGSRVGEIHVEQLSRESLYFGLQKMIFLLDVSDSNHFDWNKASDLTSKALQFRTLKVREGELEGGMGSHHRNRNNSSFSSSSYAPTALTDAPRVPLSSKRTIVTRTVSPAIASELVRVAALKINPEAIVLAGDGEEMMLSLKDNACYIATLIFALLACRPILEYIIGFCESPKEASLHSAILNTFKMFLFSREKFAINDTDIKRFLDVIPFVDDVGLNRFLGSKDQRCVTDVLSHVVKILESENGGYLDHEAMTQPFWFSSPNDTLNQIRISLSNYCELHPLRRIIAFVAVEISTCLTCAKRRVFLDPRTTSSLPLPVDFFENSQHKDLNHVIGEYLAQEKMIRFCESCQKDCSSTVVKAYGSLPKVLVLAINRIRPGSTAATSSSQLVQATKIKGPIDFPTEPIVLTTAGNIKKSYDLVAVCIHTDRTDYRYDKLDVDGNEVKPLIDNQISSKGGHFVSVVYLNGRWIKCDDADSSKIPFDLEEGSKERDGMNGYVYMLVEKIDKANALHLSALTAATAKAVATMTSTSTTVAAPTFLQLETRNSTTTSGGQLKDTLHVSPVVHSASSTSFFQSALPKTLETTSAPNGSLSGGASVLAINSTSSSRGKSKIGSVSSILVSSSLSLTADSSKRAAEASLSDMLRADTEEFGEDSGAHQNKKR